MLLANGVGAMCNCVMNPENASGRNVNSNTGGCGVGEVLGLAIMKVFYAVCEFRAANIMTKYNIAKF